MKQVFFGIAAAIASLTANATIIDFSGGVPAGLSLGGSMTFNSTGGDHLYMEQYFDDDFINFDSPTKVNSFQMNANPWEGYGFPSSGAGWLVDLEAFDASNQSLGSQTVDLSNYLTWDNWLTVELDVENVSRLAFYSPSASHGQGFWPAIDNLRINEASANNVPEPASLALLGIGLAGLGAMRRRKTA